MRAVLIFCISACYVVVGQDINAMRNMPKYDQRYDYLDVDAILDSKRLVKNYVECLINSQRCTPEGKALKRLLPEALRTKCVRCTERQKRTAVKVIKRLKYEFPEEWAKLSSRWDPTGDFTRYFEEILDKEHFNSIYGNEYTSPPILSSTIPPRPPVVQNQPPLVQYQPPIIQAQPEQSEPMVPSQPPVPSQLPQDTASTETRPLILNRFGDEGELMTASPSSNMGPRPTMPPMTMRPTMPPSTVRYVTYRATAPTPISWSAAASDSMPTRFPMRPFASMPPALTTAYTIIDQISYKIMKTTELFSDIFRNTVRAVVG